MSDVSQTRRPLKSRDTGWARRTAQWLAGHGMRPNQISLLSVVNAGIAAMALVGAGWVGPFERGLLFLVAAVFIQLRLLCNLFDGMVAIEGGFRTKSGELWNEIPDRFSDAFIFVGAGYAMPDSADVHWLGWLAALLSVITAYIRALGAAVGVSQAFEGPMAKPQRMAWLTAGCLVMAVFGFFGFEMDLMSPLLGLISVGCVVTMARRMRRIVNELESK